MVRPRRSVLYLPASNARALVKARQLPADVLVFDLEDAVAPASKVRAREQLLVALEEGGYGHRELVVRVNARGTEWHEADLEAVAHSRAHALCLPKVEQAEDLTDTAWRLEQLASDRVFTLWSMVETPTGVFNIRDIVTKSVGLEVIMMGTSDLTHELRARHTPGREPLLYALSHCVQAAREFGVDIIDGVHLDLADSVGCERACEQGRDLGFDGKSLIHPSQIAAANAAFSPSSEELDEARGMLEAWREAQASGQGVLVFRGKLVEHLHVDEARRMLALAEAIAQFA
jgi:citrate lyase subunit beta/citryl-CoA lyase